MKRLILVRHGKSSWDNNLPDNKRPLKKRAIKDAKAVLKSYKHFYSGTGMFWTSPAVRAHETAKIFKKTLDVKDDNFNIIEDLYTFNQNELLTEIQSCPDSIEELTIFAHNPALTVLVNHLGDKPLDNLPTTGLCLIEFETNSWKEIEKGKTILTLLPKNLR
ncbi:histidine phosphatase family protein [Gramella sp. AN32]|uniref:SixA phosphatase family protein n=1 Tax=Christiangramia antarctica TaxID=2058158 RepID=A0ABW5X5W6_9FLAO|nr:histidine phosphatase family protein [Gramella sp. AN32]MCM4156025.1 histidine phosphatase family protein [Gramella sp. AN32]